MEDVIFPISKSDLVKIWKHSRNKVKTDYWVKDAMARLATKINLNYKSKITNIARLANAVQCQLIVR